MPDQPVNYNISKVAPKTAVLPAPSQTSDGKIDSKPIRMADKPTIRNLAPITEFNGETGLLQEKKEQPWSVIPKTEENIITTEVIEHKQQDRHAAWKQEQEEKRLARETKQVEKAAKQQALAKSLLLKGDLVGAAKALDMSPTELSTYVDNARLSIPNKVEQLTPEQQKAKDEEQFKADRLAFEKEQREWKQQVTAINYIKENITPVLADKDKFELIHKSGVHDIQNYIYQFMNQHYQQTKEILNAADVAETIEQQLLETTTKALEANRGIKKLSKYFTPKEEQDQEATEAAGSTRETGFAKRSTSRVDIPFNPFKEPTLANKEAADLNTRFPVQPDDSDLLAEAEEEEKLNSTSPIISKRKGQASQVPFALMSRSERMALMRSGK